jgi:hypothetical protein
MPPTLKTEGKSIDIVSWYRKLQNDFIFFGYWKRMKYLFVTCSLSIYYYSIYLVGYHVSYVLIGYATSRLLAIAYILVATSGEGRKSQWLFFKWLKAAFKGKNLPKWPNFGSGLHTLQRLLETADKYTVTFLRFLNFARSFEHESDWRFFKYMHNVC